jgi:hypothetical protein
MRRGELKTEHGTRYVGEFADDGGCFRGRGELWLQDGVRHLDGEWEKDGALGCARRGMAVDSDGAVHRVEFEGNGAMKKGGAWWKYMGQAFDEKQAFRDSGWCTGASWTRLPVRARGARDREARPWRRRLRPAVGTARSATVGWLRG